MSFVLAVMSFCALAIGLKFILTGHWFLAWLRGMCGLLLIALSATIALLSFDLSRYQRWEQDKPVGLIVFEKQAQQQYIASLVLNAQSPQATKRFMIFGDQWQVDAKVIRWKGPLGAFGVKPSFQLDRISGRYMDIAQERDSPRTVHAIFEEPIYRVKTGLDVWAVIEHSEHNPVAQAIYGSATFLPMADGAQYQIALSNTGLVAKPMNDAAKSAISTWQ